MLRRSAAALPRGLLLVCAMAMLAAACSGPPPIRRASDTTTTLSSPPTTRTDASATPATANVFLPEDQNLSNCGPAVERPGCGSKAKGGWRMTLVFAILLAGIATVFLRIIRSARSRTAAQSPRENWN